jgi:hypothetical protein
VIPGLGIRVKNLCGFFNAGIHAGMPLKNSPNFYTSEKIREKALNRIPRLEETKLISVALTRPITLYNLDGTVYGEYPTIIEAAKATNCKEKTLIRALTTKRKLVKKQ